MWAYITDFPVVMLLTVLFHVHICLYSRYTFPVHVCLICTSLGFIICTRGLHLTILNPHVQILKTRLSWSCCNWLECVADPSGAIGVQQKLGHHRSSSSQLFSWLALEASLAARKHLSAFVMLPLRIMYFCYFIFWWCNIPVILYPLCDNYVFVLFC